MQTNLHSFTDKDTHAVLTRAEMLYYTYPYASQRPAADGDRLFVIDTAYDRNSSFVGTIVTLKQGSHVMNRRPWRISQDGTYVSGHLLNKNTQYERVLGMVAGEADTFHLGSIRSTIHDPMADRAGVELEHVISSDGRYPYPGIAGQSASRKVVTDWVLAAPWALDLMPRPGDTDGTVRAKIDTAKEKWQLNRAFVELASEGYSRGWTDHLKELHDNTELSFMPRPRLGAVVEGYVLVPSAGARPTLGTLDESTRRLVESLSALSSGNSMNTLGQISVPVHVSLPLDLQLDPDNMDIQRIQAAVLNSVRAKIDNRDVVLGEHLTEYFVNGLSALA